MKSSSKFYSDKEAFWERYWDVFLILLLAALSYSIYGAPYSFRFNSDDGVHVLMAADFNWQKDFYFWAQNRLGSLSPFLASWLVDIGIHPLHAISIIKYGWLLCSIMLARDLIRNQTLVSILAVAIFFPSVFYFRIVQPAHPYPEQIFAMLLATRILAHSLKTGADPGAFKTGMLGFILAVAFWVNDSTFVFLGIFLLSTVAAIALNIIKLSSQSIVSFIVCLTLPFTYIIFRKSTTRDYTGYAEQSINSIPVFFNSSVSWLRPYGNMFLSDVEITRPFAYSLLVPIFIGMSLILIVTHIRLKPSFLRDNLGSLVLILTSIAIYALVCMSEWYIKNGSNSRYLISAFYVFSIGVLWMIKSSPKRKGVILVFSLVTLLGASTGLTMKRDDRFSISANERHELLQLYDKGIIGSYWFSYAISAQNPERIAATPRQGDWMRNHTEKKKVLSRDTIFIVRNLWLESYPKTLNQYGTQLKLVDPIYEIKVGNAEMAAYQKIHN